MKSLSAQPMRIDKSSRQTAKLPSIYDFSCDKCPNRTISPKIFLLYIPLDTIRNLLESDYSTMWLFSLLHVNRTNQYRLI